MSEELEKYHKALISMKKDIADDISGQIIAEFHLVQDYMKREMDDFKKKYDNRLKVVESKVDKLSGQLWPKWTIYAIAAIVVLCLLIAALNIILILNIN